MTGREKGVTVERDKNNTANTGAGSIDIDEEVSVLQDGGIEQMTFEDICALAGPGRGEHASEAGASDQR